MRSRRSSARRPPSTASRGTWRSACSELCALVADEYGGDASRLWTEAADTADLERRIRELPGFGDMKVIALGSTLAKRLGVKVAQPLVPDLRRLGDVDSPEALEAYQAAKRAKKAAARRAQAATS